MPLLHSSKYKKNNTNKKKPGISKTLGMELMSIPSITEMNAIAITNRTGVKIVNSLRNGSDMFIANLLGVGISVFVFHDFSSIKLQYPECS